MKRRVSRAKFLATGSWLAQYALAIQRDRNTDRNVSIWFTYIFPSIRFKNRFSADIPYRNAGRYWLATSNNPGFESTRPHSDRYT